MKKIELKAKCIAGHAWTMTHKEIEEAQRFGCAMCPTCGNPATVEEAEAVRKASRPRRKGATQ